MHRSLQDVHPPAKQGHSHQCAVEMEESSAAVQMMLSDYAWSASVYTLHEVFVMVDDAAVSARSEFLVAV